METIRINQDITVMYITATSFPDGVLQAHQSLHALIPFSTERRYFGLSRPEKGGGIVYRAAAEVMEVGEAEKLKLETIVIKKGDYFNKTIRDYMKDPALIGQAFEELIDRPEIDPEGYCVEWYISNTEAQCMVRLADK